MMNEETKRLLEKRWAVVGFDCNTASQLMPKIELSCGKTVIRKIRSNSELRTEFSDGTILTWVRGTESSRGHRFGKMWCDKEIDKRIFDCVIMPHYFGEREDIIWI